MIMKRVKTDAPSSESTKVRLKQKTLDYESKCTLQKVRLLSKHSSSCQELNCTTNRPDCFQAVEKFRCPVSNIMQEVFIIYNILQVIWADFDDNF